MPQPKTLLGNLADLPSVDPSAVVVEFNHEPVVDAPRTKRYGAGQGFARSATSSLVLHARIDGVAHKMH